MWEDLILLNRMDDLPFSVELAGISYCDGSYRCIRHKSEVCVIEYIVSGSGKVTCEDKTYYPKAGDVYLLPVGSDHSYSSSSNDPWVKIFMNIYGKLTGKLLSSYGLGETYYFENVPAGDLFKDACEKARTMEGKVTRSGNGELSLIFHKIIMLLAEHQRANQDESEMKRVKEYIDANIYTKISISKAAQLIYRSKDYVIKRFVSEYGKTPYEYALERKMDAACELLRSTRLPISDIAEKLGYSDQHYFSNLFKKRIGQTPRNYRRASLI